MRSSGCLSLLGFILVAQAVAGCKLTKREPAGPFKYTVWVSEEIARVSAVEMNGQPLGTGEPSGRGRRFLLTLPKEEYFVEKKFTVVLTTSCGPTRLEGKGEVGLLRGETRADEDRERREGKDVIGEIGFKQPRTVVVYVDWDGAAGSPVEIGRYPLDPKPRTTVPLGSCPDAVTVNVRSAPVDKLDLPPVKDGAKEAAPATFFVDAKGGHCYERVLHTYVEKTVDTRNMDPSKPVRLDGRRAYLQDIDDFLTPSPSEVTSTEAYPMRTEIRRCADGPKPRADKPKSKSKPKR